MKGIEQQLAAGMEEILARWPAIGIGEAGETGIAGDDCWQGHGLYAFARKARHRQAAGHDSHVKTVFHQCIGDAAGAGYVADAEQMLDIEENTRCRHDAFCHSASNRPVSCRMLE